MTPAAFIQKWSQSELRERQGAQEHFIDLCRLLSEPTPAEADPVGDSYCFERGALKVGGGDGWADVWRRGCFGWEYKGKHKDLGAALRQLQTYAPDLQNPPYLVVSDMERIVVHTNWTNTVRRTIAFGFEDLREPAKLDLLRQVFRGSEALKPGLSPQELTATVAERFGQLGKRLQERGHDPEAVAHFLNRLIFCMFAEDAELLPKALFTRTVTSISRRPKQAAAQLDELFARMRHGGFFGSEDVRWFNGGLFDEAPALPLERDELELVAKTAAEHDWSNIDPAVFGAMFEEALKRTGKRAALGAHYTDREKILRIVEPVITRPLAAEWDAARASIEIEAAAIAAVEAERRAVHEEAAEALKGGAAAARAGEAERRKRLAAIAKRRDAAQGRARAARDAYLDRLAAFRVLDPACGSGNFLYVALQALRDLELRALVDADRLGVPQERPRVGLQVVRGIEIEPYAAELARVTLWIGDLQWERRNGFTAYQEPILDSLAQIERRDALLERDEAGQLTGAEAQWPDADVIIGNPPFLGSRRQRSTLNPNDLDTIRNIFYNRVPVGANFVVYWYRKAFEALSSGRVERFGLVGTQAIRRGASNQVFREFAGETWISDAFSNESWAVEGAAVRVSIVIVTKEPPSSFSLDGERVSKINPDLTADTADVLPESLAENRGVAYQGAISGGPFEIEGELARNLLKASLNANERPNSDVIKSWRNADDLADRLADFFVIDFGDKHSEIQAALYEQPFAYLSVAWEAANSSRSANGELPLRHNEPRSATTWWQLQRRRSRLLSALATQRRYLVTPRVAKYRYFVWLDANIVPDTRLVVVLRQDETSFGILSSRIHERWALRFSGRHGVGDDPEYVHTLTFNAFPFPEGLTPNIAAADYADDPRAQAIAAEAAELNRLRENWLNPPDLVRIEPEVYPTAAMLAAGHPKLYPDRILPVDEAAAAELKKRTLTNLYNARPAWLDMAHRRLDEAVAAAYGWPSDLSDDEILARLFALNQGRAAAGR